MKIGVIGTGWVAQDRYLPALGRDRRAEVIALADHDVHRAAMVARRFGVPLALPAHDELFDLPLDAVVVCTPPETHRDVVASALARGLHVFVEKPLAVGRAQADELVALRARGEARGCVSHNFLWSRSARSALAEIASGAAGEVLAVRGVQLSSERRRLPIWYQTLPGGLFYDEAPHLFYLARAFAGELRVVSARATGIDSGRQQSIGSLDVTLDGTDAPAQISMDFRAPVSEWLVIVTCSRMVLVVDLFRDTLLRLKPDGGHRAFDVLRSSSSLWLQQVREFALSGASYATRRLDYGHGRLVAAFLDTIEHGDPEPVPLIDGARIVGLLDDVLLAAGVTARGAVAR